MKPDFPFRPFSPNFYEKNADLNFQDADNVSSKDAGIMQTVQKYRYGEYRYGEYRYGEYRYGECVVTCTDCLEMSAVKMRDVNSLDTENVNSKEGGNVNSKYAGIM